MKRIQAAAVPMTDATPFYLHHQQLLMLFQHQIQNYLIPKTNRSGTNATKTTVRGRHRPEPAE